MEERIIAAEVGKQMHQNNRPEGSQAQEGEQEEQPSVPATNTILRGMADRGYISREMIAPVTESGGKGSLKEILRGVSVTEPKDADEAVAAILDGQALLITQSECVLANATATVKREVTEPDTDITVRGPKVGFTEDWEVNLALIRRCVKSENLKSVPVIMGDITSTRVAVVWIEGRAEEGMAQRIIKRLQSEKITGLTDSGNLETLIAGNGMLFHMAERQFNQL
jgi:spore germination protein KA